MAEPQTLGSILVVDDDPAHRTMLRTLLGGWHYVVEEADDGSQAMESVHERSYDLVLMDVRMVKVSGLEALSEIKTYNPAIPVIIMTAYSSVETAVENAICGWPILFGFQSAHRTFSISRANGDSSGSVLSYAELEAAIKGLADGVSIYDNELRVLYQNRVILNRYGPALWEKCYHHYHHRNSICPDCPAVRTLQDGRVHTAIRKVEPAVSSQKLKTIEMGESGHAVVFPMTAGEITAVNAENARLAAIWAARTTRDKEHVVGFELAESGHLIEFPVTNTSELDNPSLCHFY